MGRLWWLLRKGGTTLCFLAVSFRQVPRKDNTSFPVQDMVTLRSASVEGAVFKVSLGNPERAVQVNYPNRARLPEQVVTETMLAGESANHIKPCTYAEVPLRFPPEQAEIAVDIH